MFRNHHLHDALKSVPGLGACTDAELAQIVKLTEEVTIPAGHVLVTEGTTAYESFLILSGKAEVTRTGHHLATLSAGDFAGELALIDKGPRSATVTAVTDVKALVCDRRRFGGLLEHRAVGNLITRELAGRLRAADDAAGSY